MEFQHYANASWITFCIVWRKWRRGATNSNKDLLKVTGWRIFEILRQKRKNGRDRDAKLVSDSETTTPKTYGLAVLEDLDKHGNNSWHLGLLLWVNSFMHPTSSFKILMKRCGSTPESLKNSFGIRTLHLKIPKQSFSRPNPAASKFNNNLFNLKGSINYFLKDY